MAAGDTSVIDTRLVLLSVVAVAAILGILIRPWRSPEWLWSVGAAALLVLIGAVALPAALAGLVRGADVYAYLLGIVTLAEIARHERLFDYLSKHAVLAARGSQARLFALTFGVGVVVTALLSNDTTVVVLTPAVLAVLARTRRDPMPYLYSCAFVANAASFWLPVSNPANLVVYGRALPALLPWVRAFGLSALASTLLTYVVLRWLFARSLSLPLESEGHALALDRRMRGAFVAVGFAALTLLVGAALGFDIGYVALGAAVLALVVVASFDRTAPRQIARHLAWQIVPLVAGLFVIVEGFDRSAALRSAASAVITVARLPAPWGALALSATLAAASNLLNNLPVGLATGYVLSAAPVTDSISHAAMIGVDLGPNACITGSLATLLWLLVLRREGLNVTPWGFFRLGIVVTLPALAAATLLVR